MLGVAFIVLAQDVALSVDCRRRSADCPRHVHVGIDAIPEKECMTRTIVLRRV